MESNNPMFDCIKKIRLSRKSKNTILHPYAAKLTSQASQYFYKVLTSGLIPNRVIALALNRYGDPLKIPKSLRSQYLNYAMLSTPRLVTVRDPISKIGSTKARYVTKSFSKRLINHILWGDLIISPLMPLIYFIK